MCVCACVCVSFFCFYCFSRWEVYRSFSGRRHTCFLKRRVALFDMLWFAAHWTLVDLRPAHIFIKRWAPNGSHIFRFGEIRQRHLWSPSSTDSDASETWPAPNHQTSRRLTFSVRSSRLDGPTPTPKKIVSLQPAHLETALQIFNTFDMTVLDEN